MSPSLDLPQIEYLVDFKRRLDEEWMKKFEAGDDAEMAGDMMRQVCLELVDYAPALLQAAKDLDRMRCALLRLVDSDRKVSAAEIREVLDGPGN